MAKIKGQKSEPKSKFCKRQAAKKRAGLFFSVLAWGISALLLFFCSSNIYQQFFNKGRYTGFFGVGSAVVVSESMEPTISKNDIIIYHKAKPERLNYNKENGDIIVYVKETQEKEADLVVHRLKDISNGYAVTKGDNNAQDDEAFRVENIVGKFLFAIPNAGVAVNILSTPWASIALVLCVIAFMGVRILLYHRRKKKILTQISPDIDTQRAIEKFFDI